MFLNWGPTVIHCTHFLLSTTTDFGHITYFSVTVSHLESGDDTLIVSSHSDPKRNELTDMNRLENRVQHEGGTYVCSYHLPSPPGFALGCRRGRVWLTFFLVEPPPSLFNLSDVIQALPLCAHQHTALMIMTVSMTECQAGQVPYLNCPFWLSNQFGNLNFPHSFTVCLSSFF